jgi:hypothetical protein
MPADFIRQPCGQRAFIGETDTFVVWVYRIAGRFEDTNRMFEAPGRFDLHVTPEGTPEYWADEAARLLRPVFDPKKPTALMIGRYQPSRRHRAHLEAVRRVGQVCIAVRDTGAPTPEPVLLQYVRSRMSMGCAPRKASSR